MAHDDEWVSNVRRWCLDQTTAAPTSATHVAEGTAMNSEEALGYEATHPPLQARHWPDAKGIA